MKSQTVVGIYGSVGAAERAREALLHSGIASERVSVSASLTADGIGAEAPGQSYENQNDRGETGRDTQRARYNEALRTGACVLSVAGASGADVPRLRELMRRSGARGTLTRPA